MRRLLAVLVALAGALTLAGCTAEASGTAPITDGRPLRITTTTNFITDTVGRIGGDRLEVTGLMGPGVDPHLYRASAGDVQALREADIIFYGGLNLEGKMGDLLADLGRSRTVRAVTDGIPRDQLLRGPGTSEADPHVWFDVTLWQHASRAIAETLA
ncbi:metal ABC transporter solute-binding protein, Zn/Mn family, partial [Pseudonocardia asaccharolytica]